MSRPGQDSEVSSWGTQQGEAEDAIQTEGALARRKTDHSAWVS